MRPTMIVPAVGLLLAGLAGCGDGPKYVPVSGVVTLNGKPYPHAAVTLQPMGTKENPNPGRGSSAYTDENGRFVLKTDDGHAGAVPGKHRVRIMTRFDVLTGGKQVKEGEKVKTMKEPIPREWFDESKKEFEVPAGGTDQANFSIENPDYKE
jgi:hypothetical protein